VVEDGVFAHCYSKYQTTISAMSSFKSINYDNLLPENFPDHFEIDCPPDTDIWEKPPTTHSFNGPIIYRSFPVSAFQSAKVTVSADWKHKYDQGGLCLVINPNNKHKQWVKTGIEYLESRPNVSTVATDRWSDWSLRPMPGGSDVGMTIEIVSEDDGSLWVYLVEAEKRIPIREVTWWADVDKEAECWIGVYAAKPAKEPENLVVTFDQLAVKSK
jgi:regulation of enolase protein 1 (concanavalin A-like superfamily)